MILPRKRKRKRKRNPCAFCILAFFGPNELWIVDTIPSIVVLTHYDRNFFFSSQSHGTCRKNLQEQQNGVVVGTFSLFGRLFVAVEAWTLLAVFHVLVGLHSTHCFSTHTCGVNALLLLDTYKHESIFSSSDGLEAARNPTLRIISSVMADIDNSVHVYFWSMYVCA